MKLFTLLLVTAQAAGTVGCEIGRNLQYERTDGSSHNLDCLSSNAAHDSVVAICLLQVNKLSHVIQCTDSEEELTLSSSVEPGSPVDGVDLVPLPDGQHPDKNDGMLYYTPRGLLVSAAEPCFASNACKANLPDLFRLCPYDDIPKFVQCLCCHLVDDKDIQSLQSFINQYVLARDQQLVSDHASSSAMEFTTAFNNFIADRPNSTHIEWKKCMSSNIGNLNS
ncbi:hypothetical protein B0I35DRAFT_474407 [Stachybotrys elegans]|uniref:Cyanovirin-N domain-containing protein n=1 Tax=Stachybotrys elegans TaxID=80388 RepID=A0A8K0SYF0_9HYPO|nr:hypothetical protein B0I35DRAFT_474407 [Stachybotrys elegans]